MDANGKNVKQITNDPSITGLPRWTDDGRIVFGSDRNGKFKIYVMNADGSNVRMVSEDTPVDEYEADWIAVWYPVQPAGPLKTTWGLLKQKLF